MYCFETNKVLIHSYNKNYIDLGIIRLFHWKVTFELNFPVSNNSTLRASINRTLGISGKALSFLLKARTFTSQPHFHRRRVKPKITWSYKPRLQHGYWPHFLQPPPLSQPSTPYRVLKTDTNHLSKREINLKQDKGGHILHSVYP